MSTIGATAVRPALTLIWGGLMKRRHESGRVRVLPILTARCAQRLVRLRLVVSNDHPRAEAHAIRILLRRVGTRVTIEKILARKGGQRRLLLIHVRAAFSQGRSPDPLDARHDKQSTSDDR